MIIRTFYVPDGSREGGFRAKVVKFLGLSARPGGFALVAECDEEPVAGASLILPNGVARPTVEGSTNFMLTLRRENESPPLPLPIEGNNPATGQKQQGAIQWQHMGNAWASGQVVAVFVAPSPWGNEHLGFKPCVPATS